MIVIAPVTATHHHHPDDTDDRDVCCLLLLGRPAEVSLLLARLRPGCQATSAPELLHHFAAIRAERKTGESWRHCCRGRVRPQVLVSPCPFAHVTHAAGAHQRGVLTDEMN